MWKSAILTIGTLLLTTSTSAQCFTENDEDGGQVTRNGMKRLVTGSTEFALKLFDNVNKIKAGPEENVVISPISVWSALTATWHGAQGRTKRQIERALRYGSRHQKRVSLLYHKLTNNLQHKSNGLKDHTLNLVNKIYFDDHFQLRDCIRSDLKPETEQLALSSNPDESLNSINQWVKEQTNHLIDDLLPEGYINDRTAMVLVNAIYFKGFWILPFPTRSTKPEDFFVEPNHVVKVDTMRHDGQFFRTVQSDHLQCSAIELPLHGKNVRMVILLPDEGTNVDHIVSKLGVSTLTDLLGGLAVTMVDLRMPKFNVEESLELKDHLKDLGIKDLFNLNAANLTGFSDAEIYVEFVRHKTRIDVTETGVEAAAATGVVGSYRSVPTPFIINRPFVFLIQHEKTSAILFLGTIKNPAHHTAH